MQDDDHICLCFSVSQRKVRNWIEREAPTVASQISDCLGAGTGCGWCVPFLTQLHRQWSNSEPIGLRVDPSSYADRRDAYRAKRASTQPPSTPESDTDCTPSD